MQCSLSDAQVLMYAKELEMDPDQLAFAIALLKQDPEVWPGRFPLPGKIKSYLTSDTEDRANTMVMNVLKAADRGTHNAYSDLTDDEKEIINVYGWSNLSNMMSGQRPNYITNMRSIAKTIIKNKKESLKIIEQSMVLIEDEETLRPV